MAITRAFKPGNSQAVRLPLGFWIKPGGVEIFKCGCVGIICEKPRGLSRAFELLMQLPGYIIEEKNEKSL